MNALQRDMCPSMTKFEGEIIAMTLDLLHADAVTDADARRARHLGRQRQHPPRGARLPRARAQRRAASTARTSSSPRPAHPAFDKACHLLGIELRQRAGRPRDDAGRRRRGAPSTIDENTIAIIGSACNYGYGTIDPIERAVRPRARARRRPARRRLPRRLHPPVRPGARLRHPALRLPRPGRHDRSRPTRTSTATGSRARRCSRSATRRCATASTSS